MGSPVAVIRKNNSSGVVFSDGEWTNSNLWFGEFSAGASSVLRYEYSEGCTGNSSGVLNTSGVTYQSNQNTSRCIRAVYTNGEVSDWSLPYVFRIDKENPSTSINKPSASNSSEIEVGNCYVKENGSGKQYNNCFYKTVDVTGTAFDNYSGIKSQKISCSAVTNEGKKWNLQAKSVSDKQIQVTANVPKNVLSVEKVTCTFQATDYAGNSNTTSTNFYMGNGWWLHPGGYMGERGWYYFAEGKQVTGWHYIYWYNGDKSDGQFDWYYFFDGTETTAKNNCAGPKYEMARYWCKEIGGHPGWYYLAYSWSSVDNNRWVPDGSMLSSGTWVIDGSEYTFNSSGRCIKGKGCY